MDTNADMSCETVPMFIQQLYAMVEEPTLNHIIEWGDDGRSFIVKEPDELIPIIKTKLEKSQSITLNKYDSFVRQLNNYGFSKVASKPDRFKNKAFRRGHRDKLADIQRKHTRGNADNSKAKAQTRWTKSENLKSCDFDPDFFDFVTRKDFNQLMKVVGELRGEILHLKRKREDRSCGCDPDLAGPSLPRSGSSDFRGQRRDDNATRFSTRRVDGSSSTTTSTPSEEVPPTLVPQEINMFFSGDMEESSSPVNLNSYSGEEIPGDFLETLYNLLGSN